MAPPELNEDIAAEILLRIPPDERADLIRASAVSKLWLHVVSDPDFVRRYNSFHRREGDEVFFVSADVTSYKYTVEVNKCTFEVKPVRVTQVGEPRNYRCATLP